MTPTRLPIERGQDVLLRLTEADEWRECRAWVIENDGERLWMRVQVHADVARNWFRRGVEVRIEVSRTAEAHYEILTTVAAWEPSPEPRVALRVIDARRVQRREFFRVPVVLATRNAVLIASNGRQRPIRLRVRDVSAGGIGGRIAGEVAAESNVHLIPGDEIVFELELPDGGPWMQLRACVARVAPSLPDSEFVCDIGAAFSGLSAAERERLIRFALAVQTTHVRRGVR